MSIDFSRPYVIDGAMATELERRGARLVDDLWSARVLIENPALIRAVHLDYFHAGADIAISASYQATLAGYSRHGIQAPEAERMLALAVQLAREARDEYLGEARESDRPPPLVAASMGPYGAHLHDGSEYRGDYRVAEARLIDFHRRQLDVLARAGADFIAFETIPSLGEAQALLELLTEYPHLRAWLSFSCRDGARVSHGEPLAACVASANGHPQILAVGVNCTAPVHVESLLRAASGATRLPLLAYPNSGERWEPASNTWAPAERHVANLRTAAQAWRNGGATLIGGCCRTTPADIGVIADVMRAQGAQGR